MGRSEAYTVVFQVKNSRTHALEHSNRNTFRHFRSVTRLRDYDLSFQVLQTRDLFCMRRAVRGRTR